MSDTTGYKVLFNDERDPIKHFTFKTLGEANDFYERKVAECNAFIEAEIKRLSKAYPTENAERIEWTARFNASVARLSPADWMRPKQCQLRSNDDCDGSA